MKHWWLLLLCCIPSLLLAQLKPSGYFRYPLDSVQQYISLFNALRDNHFHSGLDLKTQEKEGLPVLASADGYVSRIKVQSIGYGKAIYLDHPNGYTTVYGHLQAYQGAIAEWVYNNQYQLQQFEFDHVFNKPLFKVKKGDTIAWSGNSGRSSGPHVHFEIRNTKTEHPVNPLLYGFGLLDTLAPQLHQLHFYIKRNHELLLAKSVNINPLKISQQPGTNALRYEDTIALPFSDFGIGFEAYDYLTDTTRKYMLYGADVAVNTLVNNRQTPLSAYRYQMTEASFENKRVINRFIDYKTYEQTNKRIQLGFLIPGADFPFFVQHHNKGWVKADSNALLHAQLQFFQFNAADSLQTSAKTAGVHSPTHLSIAVVIQCGSDSSFVEPLPTYCPYLITPSTLTAQTEHAKVEFTPESLFDTLSLCLSEIPTLRNAYSPLISVHHPETPVREAYTLMCKPGGFAAKHRNQLCWVKGEKGYQKSSWKGDYLACTPSTFGVFKVVADTVKPRITTNSFKKGKLVSTNLVFYITDNLSGIKSYKGTIDNQWELFEYDAKNDVLCFLQTEKLAPGKHQVKIVVMDDVGNTTTYQKTFTKN